MSPNEKPSSEKGSRLYGAMVVGLEEGIRLGRVYDLYIDKLQKKLRGISFKSGVFGLDREMYVAMEDVRKFSRDVVIVSGQAAAREMPAELAGESLRRLKNVKIISQAGKHIGELSDFSFDRTDGGIAELLLSENRKLQIDMAQVLIGPDVILVPAGHEAFTAQTEDEPADFMKRLFGTANWSETFRESIEELKSSMQSSFNSEKMKQTLKSNSARARETILRTSQVIQQTFDQIMKKQPDGAKKQDSETVHPTDADPDRPTGFSDPFKDPGPEPPAQNASPETKEPK